jgi:iron(III) transport system permease protein
MDWYNSILLDSWTLKNFKIALGHSLIIPSIQNSLIYSDCATLIIFFLGVAIAFVMEWTQFPRRNIINALSMLSLAVLGIVTVVGYLAISQAGHPFAFLNPIENSMTLLIIAYDIRKLPFMIRSATAGLQETSTTFEEAANVLVVSF